MNNDIAQQTVVEDGILKLLVEGLRSALAWKVTNDFSRKLSSVRFITQSFQRHLERLMALEEYDGYMGWMPVNSLALAFREERCILMGWRAKSED